MKRLFVLLISFLFYVNSFAEIPEKPNPAKLVNDFAKVLTKSERSELENQLETFARETSTQIVLVSVSDLDGYDPADFAQQIGEKWGVGQKDKNNGLVILLKPKTIDSRGQVHISTGYGLEGVLPDAVVNGAIIDNEMIPRFKQNDYFGGLVAGINVIMEISKGEYTAEQYQQNAQNKAGGGSLVSIIIIFIVLLSLFGRGRRRRFYSPGRSLPFWLAMGLLSGSNRSSGSFNNFSSGSGNFGGFGGGSFGGGGAGGSW